MSNLNLLIYTIAGKAGEGRRYVVLLIDYGTTDVVYESSLFALHSEFMKLPRQAFTVSIDDNPTLRSPSQLIGSIVCLGIAGPGTLSSYTATVLHQSANSQRNLDIESVAKQQSLKSPDINFPFTAVVAHVSSVTDFYLHKLDRGVAEDMKELEDVLQSFFLNKTNHHRIEGVDSVVCVYSQQSELYCRGVVMEQDDRESVVHMVDYGHSETIPSQDILRLATDFLKFPVFAIHCQLASSSDKMTSDHYNKLFIDMLSSLTSLTVVKG